ncbi:energy-coupling factor transporter transmembrane protein EcfT [Oceanotoga sp. DSM 15011]|jgi:energy-coupling factor transport system permease protein|uniref:energy-coupling factor transporter transmembrane component T n=1 Tax=Oceanotoga TaxID=1255275 RepID=UPI0021F4B26A|nr:MULTISPECIES: energy-coupling factor transporter transmembrane component T [Oceanotoga]MDO7976789.1 energy-coupling factor transporter transmembrane protein EcfT [Oceanotoga teriensis]UYP00579.1 energy-coupling factor transporter transmembrane protein EcfT [Oceanotoga sp. DSM 15011]
MMFDLNNSFTLDPRTEILLLFIINGVAFMQRSIYIETFLVFFIAILLFLCGCRKHSFYWLLSFLFLLIIQYFLFPIAPSIFINLFSIIVMYSRKIFPCLMFGTLIIKKTSVRTFILALQKWKIPQSIIIPLAITIRYFPALKEERNHIKDAFKLRGIKGFKKFECYLVPIMISATNTSEELSAAAVTRGIENPIKKTSLIDLKFHYIDFFSLLIGIIFLFVSIILRIENVI